MPQMANIVLNDATSPTPVAHTFKPLSLVNNQGKYAETTGALKGWNRIQCDIRPAAANNGGHRVTWKITQPILIDPDDGECCVPHGAPVPANLVTVEFLRSNESDDQAVADLLAFLGDLITNSQFVATTQGESLR